MTKLKKGDLVEPTEAVVASYSNYGLNPYMEFEPGMLGVVRHFDKDIGGYQVEFFHPATGCMEAVRTFHVSKVEWPEGLKIPNEDPSPGSGWWFCGSLCWRSSINLLRAVSALRPEYLKDLVLPTLRIPGIHSHHIRKDADDAPETYMDRGNISEILASL